MRFPWSKKSNAAALNERAMKHLERGDTVRAEETALEAIREAEPQSGPWYDAQMSLATVFIATGQMERAAKTLEDACAGPNPTDADAQKARLTVMMNLGEVLIRLDRLDDAEKVLRDGLDARRLFYGPDHAGYGFGLEPLGELLLARGKYAEALRAFDEVVANFRRNQHPRLPEVLALQAIGRIAAEDSAAPFAGMESLSASEMEKLAHTAVNKAMEYEPSLGRRAFLALHTFLAGRLGETHQTTLNVLSLIANRERELGTEGDMAVRVEAIQRAKKAYQSAGRHGEVVMTLQALALAQSDGGDAAGSEESYRESIGIAERSGDKSLLAGVQRNYGLLLADRERRDEAEQFLRLAVTTAEGARDRDLAARSRIALGIFLQHGGRLEEARPLLETAMKQLPASHPDAITARSHLKAIVTGGSCGCGDTGEALCEAFREFVLSRVSSGLLEDLKVTVNDEGFQFQVQLKREPKPDEIEHLNRLLQHASNEFRNQLQNAG